jgi:hypothetical protein
MTDDEIIEVRDALTAKADDGPLMTCCADGARFIALRYGEDMLANEWPNRDAFFAAARDTRPQWKIIACDRERQHQESMVIACCPFCAVPVPEIRLAVSPPSDARIMTVVDGGYYCATCEERLDSCDCVRPERLWEAVR